MAFIHTICMSERLSLQANVYIVKSDISDQIAKSQTNRWSDYRYKIKFSEVSSIKANQTFFSIILKGFIKTTNIISCLFFATG